MRSVSFIQGTGGRGTLCNAKQPGCQVRSEKSRCPQQPLPAASKRSAGEKRCSSLVGGKVSERQDSGKCVWVQMVCCWPGGQRAVRGAPSPEGSELPCGEMQKSTLGAMLPHRRYPRCARPAVACSSVATAQVRQRCTMPSAADCSGGGRWGSEAVGRPDRAPHSASLCTNCILLRPLLSSAQQCSHLLLPAGGLRSPVTSASPRAHRHIAVAVGAQLGHRTADAG